MPHQCTNCGRTFADGSKEMLSGCPNCGGNKFQFRPSGTVDEGELAGSSAEPSPPDDPDEGGFADAAARAGAAVRDKLSGGRDDEVEASKPSTLDAAPSGTSEPTDPETEATVSSQTSTPSEVPESSQASTSPEPSPSETEPSPSETEPSPSETEPSPSETEPSTSESPTDSESAATSRVDPAERQSNTADRDNQEDSAQAQARSDVVSREELSAEAQDVTAESSAAPPDAEPPPDADGTVIEPSSEDRPDLEDLREELNDQFESIKVVNPGQYELNLMELYDREEYIISLKEDGRYVIEVPDTWHEDE